MTNNKIVKGRVDGAGETWVCLEDVMKSLFEGPLSRRHRYILMCYIEKLRERIRGAKYEENGRGN